MHAAAGNPDVQIETGGEGSPMREQELEDIFAEFLDPIYRYLYARVGNKEDAEDLASQVFLKASRQLDSGRSHASVASWLFTVAGTVLADHWRGYYRAPPQLELFDDIVADRPQVDPVSSTPPLAEQRVEAVLSELPPRYRHVLELRFLQGYSINEAAAAMGVTPGNLKVMQHRALARAAGVGFPSMPEDTPESRSSPDTDVTVTPTRLNAQSTR